MCSYCTIFNLFISPKSPALKVLPSIKYSKIPCFQERVTLTNYECPSGVIVMWSGSIKNIPKGWLLCDGTKGTPDLRERFVLGTAENSEIGDRGEIKE